MLIFFRSSADGFNHLFVFLFLTFFLFVLLVGCQTTGQMKKNEIKSILQRGNACKRNIDNNPSYYNFVSQRPKTKDLTAVHFEDTRIPTVEDVNIIISMHNDENKCNASFIEDLSRVWPRIIPNLVDLIQARDRLTGEFIKRKMTYGEFHEKKKAILDEYTPSLKEECSRAERELAMLHKAELAEREKFMDNFLQALVIASYALEAWSNSQQQRISEQQKYMPMNQMRMTSCHRVGDYISCTTY